MHFVKLAWNQLTTEDVSSCIESIIRTVLGVNFEPENNDLDTPLPTNDVGPLPFDLEPSDLRVLEQLEKQMEIKLDNEALLALEENDFFDEQFMGLKLAPPKKREIHAALEVSIGKTMHKNGLRKSATQSSSNALKFSAVVFSIYVLLIMIHTVSTF